MKKRYFGITVIGITTLIVTGLVCLDFQIALGVICITVGLQCWRLFDGAEQELIVKSNSFIKNSEPATMQTLYYVVYKHSSKVGLTLKQKYMLLRKVEVYCSRYVATSAIDEEDLKKARHGLHTCFQRLVLGFAKGLTPVAAITFEAELDNIMKLQYELLSLTGSYNTKENAKMLIHKITALPCYDEDDGLIVKES